jgi:hypothetical protein
LRLRLCETHQLADAVRLTDGSVARLCQRCHRLHPLSAFSGTKHACKQALAALAAANSRRRAACAAPSPQQSAQEHAQASAAASPDGSAATAAPTPGRGDARACDDIVSWLSNSVAPAGAPAAAAAAAAAALPEGQPFVVRLSPNAPDANLAAAAAALALHGFAIHIKLPHCASPIELPSPPALRGALGAAFPDAVAPPSVALLPGCVLLLVDALLPWPGHDEAAPEAQAAARIAAALRGAGLVTHAAALGACVTVGGVRCLVATSQTETLPPDEAPAFWLAPQAVLTLAGGGSDVQQGDDVALSYDGAQLTLVARCGGQHVRVSFAPQDGRLRLHRGDAAAAAPIGGALLLQPAAAARSNASRVVLLCGADAALAAEVNAACAQLGLREPPSDAGGGANDQMMQRVLCILGAALRPRAPLRVRQAAGAAAVWLGWEAAASALVRIMQSEHDGAGPLSDECDVITALALHMAAHASAARIAGCAPAADAVMAALATAPGAPQPHVAEAAWRLAGAALQRASDAGHADPGCAVAVARRDVDGADAIPECKAHAQRVLHGVWRLILEREALTADDDGDGVDDEAAGGLAVGDEDDDEDEDEDAAYDAHLLLQNRTLFNMSGLMSCLSAASTAFNLQRFVLHAPAWPPLGVSGTAGALVERVRLYPATSFGGGPAHGARDAVPWDVVQSHAALMRAFSLAVHLPMAAALLLLSLRLTAARARTRLGDPRLFAALHACESLAALVCDVLCLHATGAAPAYPAVPLLVRALGTWFVCVLGPYRPALVWAVLGAQLLGVFGVPVAAGRLPAVLRDSPAHLLLAAVLLRCIVTVRGRDRRLRAEFAAQRTAERARVVAAAAQRRTAKPQEERQPLTADDGVGGSDTAREQRDEAMAAAAAVEEADAGAEEEERAYDEFLMVQNRFVWQTTSGLGLLGALLYTVQGVRVLGRTDWPSADELKVAMPLIDAIVLRRPTWSAQSAAIRPRDVPWPAVRFGSAVYVAYSVALHIPGMLVLMVLSWRRTLPRWRHAPAHMVLLSIPETFAALLCDALVFNACGAVPEYSTAVPVLLRAVAVILCVQRCMARPGVMYAVFANRALCTFGALLVTGHWRVLFSNFGYAITAVSLAYLAATVGARERKMRAAFALHRAARVKKVD